MPESCGNGGEEVWTLNDPLSQVDPEVHAIIVAEKDRQRRGLEMIASENFTSLPVMECMGSCLHNKYSEGQPGQRYYGGNEFIDKIELLAQHRALDLYGLDHELWGVNVQPYSGSPANFAVYTAIVEPHGRIMGLDLPDGGHLTHGFYTSKMKVSATSLFFESLPYKVDPATGLIDYDGLEANANLFKPKMIVAGISCYSRKLDYARFRAIADQQGSWLMADMAHVAGLVAAGEAPSPFEYCDVVTTTCHKTLRGARAGIIFYRKGVRSVDNKGNKVMYDIENKINLAVFPGLQGGPHNHAIAGVAVAMKQAKTEEFRAYQRQVVKNARFLASGLQDLGYCIVTGGTDCHIVHVDLKKSPGKLSGAKGELLLEEVNVSCNKNTVPGDKSALNPSGIRLGTPALTTRGLKEADMGKVVNFIDSALKLAAEIQEASGPKLVDFKIALSSLQNKEKVQTLRTEIETFALQFRLPGQKVL
jgi:glycine hydroxymethyltransferase